MGHVGGVGGIADMPNGRNAIFVEDVEIELIPSNILSSDNTNYKNDIQ